MNLPDKALREAERLDARFGFKSIGAETLRACAEALDTKDKQLLACDKLLEDDDETICKLEKELQRYKNFMAQISGNNLLLNNQLKAAIEIGKKTTPRLLML